MSYLASCTADSDGYCNVPAYVAGESDGYLTIKDINITYTNDGNPVILNVELISRFLNNSNGHTNIPITITSTQNGTIEVSDIKYDYRGGNKTYVLTFHNLNNSYSDEENITFYYSDYAESLPTGLEYVDFFPISYTQKNLSAYGQDDTIPIFNITTRNSGGDMNLSLLVINPNECFTIYYSTTNDVTETKELVNNTWTQMNGTIPYNSNEQVWLWVSLDCSASSGIGYPDFYFRGCYANADVCDEDLS